MANFSLKFSALFSRIWGPPPPQKIVIHAQNSRPELSASLSIFTFSNPKLSTPIYWKISRSPSGIEIFKRDWRFQARHPRNPYSLWGILKVEIETFKRDWKFQARLIPWGPKAHQLASPHFLPPARCDFSQASRKGRFPFLAWENRISQGIENRGSLTRVPLALRIFFNLWVLRRGDQHVTLGSGQEVCFCPSRPDPVSNAREQDGTRTGRDGPHLGAWMGPKHCKTKHMANLDGTTSDPGWGLDGPRIGPRRGSGWHPPRQ